MSQRRRKTEAKRAAQVEAKAIEAVEAADAAEAAEVAEVADSADAPDAAPTATAVELARPAASTDTNSGDETPPMWIEGLARVISMTADRGPAALRTALACAVTPERKTLFLPPEMPTLQPDTLRYLNAFAQRNGFDLVEDRRRNRVSPLRDQRDGKPPAVALGLAMLMKQTGLPGPTAMLSEPHRLAPDSPLIDVPELVRMAAGSVRRSKRIVLLPNQPLVDVLDNDTQPISGYACKFDSEAAKTVLSHFDGPAIRCIGYSTGRQYVMHLFLAGGPLAAPTLWTHPRTLTRTQLRFRLFRGRHPSLDFGLLYSTFYYDMGSRQPTPWWLADLESAGAMIPAESGSAAGGASMRG